jgi:L-seryl-tRNA(Ser) seleniumtransferase
MSNPDNQLARRLPSVTKILENATVQEALERLPRSVLLHSIQDEIGDARAAILHNGDGGGLVDMEAIALNSVRRAETASSRSLRPAVNATGIILHTGLGRAVLSSAAIEAMHEAATGHSTLEIDTESGKRGSRQDHVSRLLRSLTGAESAMVVNNNAGAVFLAVNALAAGKEVLLSRGEIVEIGGSFRMPDIIRAGGATLVEVGTTNRTRISDYESAITERTGLILRCHPSNFKILGFTQEASTQELVDLGKQRGIPVMDDLGSGALIDLAPLGVASVTTLRQAVATGCDIITASGDKLLGGPQAGIMLGKSDVIQTIKSHPLARALRMDKMSLAALEATLRIYLDEDTAKREIPTLRYIARTKEELRDMASKLAAAIVDRVGDIFEVSMVDEHSQIGGGSLPGENLPTVCVRLKALDIGVSADMLAHGLRNHRPAILGRIREDALLFDPRTLEDHEFPIIADALLIAVGGAEH